jgi:16S rRNA (cytidine1402-2'-O)-methyltransferase
MGTLYLVATPIGNLEDVSARALRILREVALIAAEDTRQTRKLLSHFNLHTPLVSYHEHSQVRRMDSILDKLDEADVALVSDAGTPALNDPGYDLVRAALKRGYSVTTVPGACAPIAALVVSGLPTDKFLYLGYLPHRAGDRRRLLKQLAGQPYTLIFLETPHRLKAALVDMLAMLGDRQIAIAREMTKLHEQILRGQISAAQAYYAEREILGEITLVVAGCEQAPERWDESRLNQEIEAALTRGEAPSRIASHLAASSGWPRREIYRKLTGFSPPDHGGEL